MTTAVKETTITEELETVRNQSEDGKLKAEEAVIWASNHPDSKLYNKLEWDDNKAGHEYRIWQMRKIIEVTVIIIPQTNEPVQAYVSLYSDRNQAGGGYRPITEVLSQDDLRKQLLRQALKEFTTWEQRYSNLQELDKIFKAAKRIKDKNGIN